MAPQHVSPTAASLPGRESIRTTLKLPHPEKNKTNSGNKNQRKEYLIFFLGIVNLPGTCKPAQNKVTQPMSEHGSDSIRTLQENKSLSEILLYLLVVPKKTIELGWTYDNRLKIWDKETESTPLLNQCCSNCMLLCIFKGLFLLSSLSEGSFQYAIQFHPISMESKIISTATGTHIHNVPHPSRRGCRSWESPTRKGIWESTIIETPFPELLLKSECIQGSLL